jgi:flagellar FliL protein
MATAAKPGTTTKPGATEETAAPPPKKSKKTLIIIIVTAVLLIGGGTTAYFFMKPAHPPAKNAAKDEATDEAADTATDTAADAASDDKAAQIKYIPLGTFTANLIHEEGDRYLQVAISLKLSKPNLEEKIKETNPEILHHVNMILQSRRPSELASLEGKEKLANDLKNQIERVLGFSKPAEVNSPTLPVTGQAASTTPAAKPAPAPPQPKSGIEEVLFTSFIIQ